MVPPDSQQIPRARCYSGTCQGRYCVFVYPTVTVSGSVSQTDSTNNNIFSLPAHMAAWTRWVPRPRTRNPCQVSHAHGLASSAFARHYSRNHGCFLFLRVLRCFTSPRYLPHPMYSDTGNTTSLVLGFPIRTSSDPRSVGSSPRHIAASHVLHQLLMPRHPPCALNNLTPQTIKDARIHYAILKHQPAHPPQHEPPTPTTGPVWFPASA